MRPALASALALALVVAAGVASALIAQRDHLESLGTRAAREAALAAVRFAETSAAELRLLRHVCTRDVHVERLALELAAGGLEGPDASRSAVALSRLLAAEVWLMVERTSDLELLGASGTPPTSPLSRGALRAAAEGPRRVAGEPARLVTACMRSAGRDQLWVVRVADVATIRPFLPGPHDVQLFVRSDGELPPPIADEHADRQALHIAGVDGAAGLTVFARAAGAPPLSTLLAFAPPLALLIAFTAALAYLLASKPTIDDSVLVTLEQAAARVAGGDLTARIGLRAGGRADQTFQTFDRMTAELQEMRSRLADAERVAAWQDMARRIAHEIKNPLSPIQIAIETLRKAHQKRLAEFDEIFEESTRAILEEVRRMEHIVREFSEFARLPRAKPGALELGALIDDTLALYQPEDVRVEVVHGAAAIALHADREQLTQVLVNLLQNAADAARSAAAPAVTVRTESLPGAALVHVDDNGPGIPEAERERVFEPYYTTKDHGTGLGLAIVRRIAFDHEGSVHVSASPLGGARFTLRLPRRS